MCVGVPNRIEMKTPAVSVCAVTAGAVALLSPKGAPEG